MADVSNRRSARELALQVLFQKEFVPDVPMPARLDYFREHIDIPDGAWAYAEDLLTGLEEHLSELDQKIAAASRNWKISRMAPVDLCILRMGAFELIYKKNEVPPKVVIDEAIEVAKRYGGTDSAAFINGLLDELFKREV